MSYKHTPRHWHRRPIEHVFAQEEVRLERERFERQWNKEVLASMNVNVDDYFIGAPKNEITWKCYIDDNGPAIWDEDGNEIPSSVDLTPGKVIYVLTLWETRERAEVVNANSAMGGGMYHSLKPAPDTWRCPYSANMAAIRKIEFQVELERMKTPIEELNYEGTINPRKP